MRRVKHSVRAPLLVVALLIALLAVSPGTASAASVWDGTYRVTGSVGLSNGNSSYGDSCAFQDYSTNWFSLFDEAYANEPNSTKKTAILTKKQSLVTALESGRWGLAQYSNLDGGGPNNFLESIYVYWTEDASLSLLWYGAYQGDNQQIRAISQGGGVGQPGASPVHVIEFRTQASFSGNGCGARVGELETRTDIQVAYEGIIEGEEYWNFFIYTDYPNYPSGYEGELIRSEPPAAKYVAMGDSFSSGEGNEPFENGTDTSSNTCHRSPLAWPRLLQNDYLERTPTALVACSGAVSNYIINEYNQENVELPQAAFVTSATQLVTISIGGNDIGFGNVLVTCTLATEEEGTTSEKHQIEHDACIEAIDDARDVATSSTLQDDLEAVFSGLRTLGNQDLQVIVVGYPNLLPAHDDIMGTCVWGGGEPETSGRAVASDETQKSRLLHDELNATIEDAVDATNDSSIHFVDPSSAFAGHELCRTTPWFNGVVPSVDPVMRSMSYHPNNNGQIAYATVVGTEVDNLFP